MKTRLLLVACVATLLFLLAPASSGLAQGPTGGDGAQLASPEKGGPFTWPGVPSSGLLTAAQIKQRPAPSKDLSGLTKQLEDKLAALDQQANQAGVKKATASAEQSQAITALQKSLTANQRKALAAAFSKREAALKQIMAPVQKAIQAGDKSKMSPKVEAVATQLSRWQAGLDAAVRGILTPKQMQLYRTVRPKAPVNARSVDVSTLGLPPVKSAAGTSVVSYCSTAYYAYLYGYYMYLYGYYGFYYAFYGYITSAYPDTYDYYALLYALDTYGNAYYGYLYDYYGYVYAQNSTYSYYGYYFGYYAYYYAYYAYIYSYYAYYYLTDSYGYLYASYVYNYYSYIYSYYGYINGYYGYVDSLANVAGDDDGDALLNGWEIYGYSYLNNGTMDVDLPCLGARSTHKDIFVEMDYMVHGSVSYAPTSSEQSRMQAMFANSPVSNPDGSMGINLHLNLAAQVPYQQNLPDPWVQVDAIKSTYFPASHRAIYHYQLWADSYGTTSSSGLSRGIPAADFIVTLGHFWSPEGGTSDYKVGTFNHELGHNLGLTHGGNDSVNYKPNYLSIMNYMWQLTGLYYNGSFGLFDYQRMDLPTLNESSLSESAGLGGNASGYGTYHYCPSAAFAYPASSNVDWNCSGAIDGGTVSKDINNDGSLSILGTQNNWPNLVYNGGGILGVSLTQAQVARVQAATTKFIQEPSMEELLRIAQQVRDAAAKPR